MLMYLHTLRFLKNILPNLIYMDVLYAGFAGAKNGHNNSVLPLINDEIKD